MKNDRSGRSRSSFASFGMYGEIVRAVSRFVHREESLRVPSHLRTPGTGSKYQIHLDDGICIEIAVKYDWVPDDNPLINMDSAEVSKFLGEEIALRPKSVVREIGKRLIAAYTRKEDDPVHVSRPLRENPLHEMSDLDLERKLCEWIERTPKEEVSTIAAALNSFLTYSLLEEPNVFDDETGESP